MSEIRERWRWDSLGMISWVGRGMDNIFHLVSTRLPSRAKRVPEELLCRGAEILFIS